MTIFKKEKSDLLNVELPDKAYRRVFGVYDAMKKAYIDIGFFDDKNDLKSWWSQVALRGTFYISRLKDFRVDLLFVLDSETGEVAAQASKNCTLFTLEEATKLLPDGVYQQAEEHYKSCILRSCGVRPALSPEQLAILQEAAKKSELKESLNVKKDEQK